MHELASERATRNLEAQALNSRYTDLYSESQRLSNQLNRAQSEAQMVYEGGSEEAVMCQRFSSECANLRQSYVAESEIMESMVQTQHQRNALFEENCEQKQNRACTECDYKWRQELAEQAH